MQMLKVIEYPPLQEQLDKIYHSGGRRKADIKAIKDKYPKTKVGVTNSSTTA